MTLNISPLLKNRRKDLQKLMYKHKLQLAFAYASQEPQRIFEAKNSLIKICLEFHGSPELGPPQYFDWDYRLEMMLVTGADPTITWAMASHALTMWEVAELFRESLNLA